MMINIAKGEEKYKQDFAKMILISADYFTDLFGNKIDLILEELYTRRRNLFSFEHSLFALEKDKVVGMILFYDYPTKKREDVNTGLFLFRKLLFSMIKKLPVFLRLNKTIGSLKAGACYISNIATYEDYRGRGIAKRLLFECEKTCRRLKMSSIVLDVEKKNLKAISLYKYAGFSEIDSYKIKFRRSHLAFIRMEKRIIKP